MKLFAFILLVLLVFLNLFRGSADIPVEEGLKVLSGGNDNEIFRVIVLENRLPQTVTAIISGSALAVSGLIMQTVL